MVIEERLVLVFRHEQQCGWRAIGICCVHCDFAEVVDVSRFVGERECAWRNECLKVEDRAVFPERGALGDEVSVFIEKRTLPYDLAEIVDVVGESIGVRRQKRQSLQTVLIIQRMAGP